MNENESKNFDVSLDEELQSHYIDYAMSVIIGRAIPDVRDGLKPVQRRILYAMRSIKNTHDQPTKKSARIVGECFVKDTFVLTENGLIPIQDVKKGDRVYTQKGLQKVSEIYIMPKRNLLKIKLKGGIENTVTNSQKFKILDKDWNICWKDANKLDVGDYVVMKPYYPEIAEEVCLDGKRINENIGYLLGQFLSVGFVINGNETGKYSDIGFYSADINVINHIAYCLKQEFDYSTDIEEKHQQLNTANGQVLISKIYQIRISNRQVCRFFADAFGLLGCEARPTQIPKQIFGSPKTVIFSFLSGLIDGDCYIHNNENAIEYATPSEDIANRLLVLLHHLGIFGEKYFTQRSKRDMIIPEKNAIGLNEDVFSIKFNGINAGFLAENLGLHDKKKKERAEHLADNRLLMVDDDIMPWVSEKAFDGLREEDLDKNGYEDSKADKSWHEAKYGERTKTSHGSYLRMLSLQVSQIIERGIKDKLDMSNPRLSHLIDLVTKENIRFYPVASIVNCNEDITYDIQVENEHEFVANGMIAHNCIGKYHPHGDISVYEALVRMAQDFSMNTKLVEGQGNFGSVDGDPPAAMRYTEVRLTKAAEDILSDLDKNTVRFVGNFDNTEEEPIVLPSKFPNLLVNGSYGIAVGVATSMPPHNVNEVCDAIIHVLDNKEASVEEILGIIRGPDFPTGGIVVMSKSAYEGYAKGRGQVHVRAKADIDENKKNIVITEIPYNVNKSAMIEGIANLVNEKKIIGINDIRDESDKEGIRIVIELKKDINGENILNALFKYSQLETTFPVINLGVTGNNLKTFNVLTLINAFIDHRRNVVRKRSEFELDVAKDRLHIVEGLIVTIDNIHDIVKLIKESKETKEARQGIMNAYSLSEKQADAILDMKLSRLTHLEFDSLSKEKSTLEERISYYSGVLEDPTKIDGIIKEETEEMKRLYGRPRRTQIINEEEFDDIAEEDTITDKKTTVIFTNTGYMKRLDIGSYKEQARGGKGITVINLKEGDYVKQILSCNTKDFLLCLTDKGNAHWLKVYRIPEAGRYAEGKAIVNMLDLNGEKVIKIFSLKDFENSKMLLLTEKGLIKKMSTQLFSHPRNKGIRALHVNEGDLLKDAVKYTMEKNVIIGTRKGSAIKFDESDLRFIGRTSMGVRGIKLKAGDSAQSVIVCNDNGYILTITEGGYGKLTEIDNYRKQRRGGSGVRNIKINEKTGMVAKIGFVENLDKSEIMLINTSGIAITFGTDELRITGRSARGVRAMRLPKGARVVDFNITKKEE